MHPKEYKREKAATGKLSHACLPNSEIIWEEDFTHNKRLNEILQDPKNYVVLLYPSDRSLNVSKGEFLPENLSGRQLVVLLLDGTWACAKKMLKLSANLHPLPRLMFTPTAQSQFHIKQQPDPLCLSTIETIQQFLEALTEHGLEEKGEWVGLMKPFMAMQRYQVEASLDPSRKAYRAGAGTYKKPAERDFKPRSRNLFYKD
jgi:DTW domain-containing protein YfiP